MTRERWEQIGQLYEAARQRPPRERAAYLEARCGEDEALRREVESLLSAEAEASGFLASGAMKDAARLLVDEESASPGGRVPAAEAAVTPERWQQIKELYRSALEREPAERPAFLDRTCAEDPTLRRAVESLLAANESETSFLEQPAIELATGSLAGSRSLLVRGQRVGRYGVLEQLGAGGMGEVYLAEDSRLGRRVALKLLPPELARDAERRARFEQEARAASALTHPNVCTIHEVGEADDGRHFIAMEYVEGRTLRARLRDSSLELTEALEIAVQVARAIEAAHAVGVVHRDIKPENVMVRPDGYVKVLDFGLAKLLESPARALAADSAAAPSTGVETETGVVMGTASYMSPEQARGLPVDARTDVWSLGVVLYEMVTGSAPFAGPTTSDVIAAILDREPEPLAGAPTAMSTDLQRIVSTALRKDREERYRSVKDLLLDLKGLKQDVEEAARREASPDSAKRSTSAGAARAGAAGASAGAAELSGSGLTGTLRRYGGLLALLALAVAVGSVAYLFTGRRTPGAPLSGPRMLSRVTFAPGLQADAAWSPDGHFIAYSSDQSGNFDIWVQPVGGGDPVQVTRSPAHETQPDWSPDGNSLVFRSERDGGGLFVVPALGGRERKLSAFGYRPRWAPHDSRILFVNAGGLVLYEAPKVFVATLDGSPPQQILAEFLTGFYGLEAVEWHPDGQRVSIWGRQEGQAYTASTWNAPLTFWTVSLSGDTPVQSERAPGVEEHIKKAGLTFSNFRWAPSGRALYLEGVSNEVRNLWRVAVDPRTLQWTAGPERLTTGLGSDTGIALSADGTRLAFTTRVQSTRVWSLPFDARTGKVKGDGQPVTPAGLNVLTVALSPDGTRIVYTARQPGTQKEEMRELSLADGREAVLAADEFVRSIGAICWSRDGTRLAYNRLQFTSPERTGVKRARCVMPAGGGEEQVLRFTGTAFEWPSDWSADGYWLLGNCATAEFGVAVCMFPVAAAHGETEPRVLASDPEHYLWRARLSPDERWVCFVAQKRRALSIDTINVIAISGGEWRRITDERYFADQPRWSPDGKTLYFVSNQGSVFFNVWGRHFDSVLGQPVGESFQVTSFGSPNRMISSPLVQRMDISVGNDRLMLPITEASGSIWVLENLDR